MLSKSPITLALLEAGNNSEKLENEIRQLYSIVFFCIVKKNSDPKQFINIWLVLLKNGNNIHEH